MKNDIKKMARIKKSIKKKENKFYSLSENIYPDRIYNIIIVERDYGKNKKRRKS